MGGREIRQLALVRPFDFQLAHGSSRVALGESLDRRRFRRSNWLGRFSGQDRLVDGTKRRIPLSTNSGLRTRVFLRLRSFFCRARCRSDRVHAFLAQAAGAEASPVRSSGRGVCAAAACEATAGARSSKLNGYDVELVRGPASDNGPRLFFVNLGGYVPTNSASSTAMCSSWRQKPGRRRRERCAWFADGRNRTGTNCSRSKRRSISALRRWDPGFQFS